MEGTENPAARRIGDRSPRHGLRWARRPSIVSLDAADPVSGAQSGGKRLGQILPPRVKGEEDENFSGSAKAGPADEEVQPLLPPPTAVGLELER